MRSLRFPALYADMRAQRLSPGAEGGDDEAAAGAAPALRALLRACATRRVSDVAAAIGEPGSAISSLSEAEVLERLSLSVQAILDGAKSKRGLRALVCDQDAVAALVSVIKQQLPERNNAIERIPSGHCARPKDAAVVLERMQWQYGADAAAAGLTFRLLQLLLRILQRANQLPEILYSVVDSRFIRLLSGMGSSPEPRERTLCCTALHSIYGRLPHSRPWVRDAIGGVFVAAAAEEEARAALPLGPAALLELYVCIARGLVSPLRPENAQFFRRCLLPLHKHHHLPFLLSELVPIIAEYLKRKPELLRETLAYLLRHWPTRSITKQLSLFDELSALIKLARSTLDTCGDEIARVLRVAADGVQSAHAGVGMTACIFVWACQRLPRRVQSLPSISAAVSDRIVPALRSSAKQHWSMSVRETAATVLFTPWLARARGRSCPSPTTVPSRQQEMLVALEEKRTQFRAEHVPELDRLQALVATAMDHCLEMRRVMTADDVAGRRPEIPPSPTDSLPRRSSWIAAGGGHADAGAGGGGDEEEEERDVTADDVMPRSPVTGHHYPQFKWLQQTSGSTAQPPREGHERRGPHAPSGHGEQATAAAVASTEAPAAAGDAATDPTPVAAAAAAVGATAEAKPRDETGQTGLESQSSGGGGEGGKQAPSVPGPPSRSRGKLQLARLHLPLPAVPVATPTAVNSGAGDSEGAGGDGSGPTIGPTPPAKDSDASSSYSPSTGRTLDEGSSTEKHAGGPTSEESGGKDSDTTPRGDDGSGSDHASTRSMSRAASDSSLRGPRSRAGAGVGAALSAVRIDAPAEQDPRQRPHSRALRRKRFAHVRESGSDSDIMERPPATMNN